MRSFSVASWFCQIAGFRAQDAHPDGHAGEVVQHLAARAVKRHRHDLQLHIRQVGAGQGSDKGGGQRDRQRQDAGA
jgi:hypothetical protein